MSKDDNFVISASGQHMLVRIDTNGVGTYDAVQGFSAKIHYSKIHNN